MNYERDNPFNGNFFTATDTTLKQLLTICILHALLSCALPTAASSQADSNLHKQQLIIEQFSDKMLNGLNKKYQKLNKKLVRFNSRSLQKLQQEETGLLEKAAKQDSLDAGAMKTSAAEKYANMLAQVQQAGGAKTVSLNNYLPGLDSLQTAFGFLEKSGGKIPGAPLEKMQKLQSLSAQLTNVQAQIQHAGDIKKFMAERKQLLKQELEKLGMTKELMKVNKQVYYYQQQINEYKAMLNDPDKLAKKALELVRDVPAFKDFMSRNSLLARLFPMPAGYGTADALLGLQTRSGVQQQLTQQLGSGTNPQQYLQQQVSQAQAQMDALKDKVNKLGGGGSDLAIPEFKPNNQKTKSFWKRIEYGLNIQSQKTNAFLPTTSDIALTAGYKLSDKSTIGVGAGYKLGWGKNISNIHLTNQGLSLRSYVDIKLKGSIWISGGYEENYQHEFTQIDQLKDRSAWQRSGLIGVTKKYSIGKKKGNMQLLWDLLSYGQVPKTPALKFRIGYNF